MKAQDARDIALKAETSNAKIDGFYAKVMADIQAAAEDGQYQVALSLPIECSLHHKNLVIKRLESDGFRLKEVPNPDPGNPTSYAYTSIRW